MKRLLTGFLCLALSAGGVVPGRALYTCAMSGKSNQTSCCCPSPASPGPGNCSDCSRAACSALVTARETREPGTEPSPSVTAPSVAGRCCSLSYERTLALASLSSGASQAEWKVSLDAAKTSPAAFLVLAAFLEPPAVVFGPPERPEDESGGRAGPLYLLHRSLLL